MRHLDLFSGIGGFALAASWAGFQTIGFSEIDNYASRVLKRHWPDVPNYGDIRNIKGAQCDLLTGGFPCQPFSVAGKQRGKEDNRYLWPEMLRVIKESRPTWVIGENVTGIVHMALDQVLFDLESEGYETLPFIIPACAVDAPHRRDRVWIVGHSACRNGKSNEAIKTQSAESRCTNRVPSICERSQAVADTENKGLEGRQIVGNSKPELAGFRESSRAIEGHWLIEPELGRVAHGIPSRVDRLKCLGNAIVPQVAYEIMNKIVKVEKELER